MPEATRSPQRAASPVSGLTAHKGRRHSWQGCEHAQPTGRMTAQHPVVQLKALGCPALLAEVTGRGQDQE